MAQFGGCQKHLQLQCQSASSAEHKILPIYHIHSDINEKIEAANELWEINQIEMIRIEFNL
jgi:hypothetical protein